ncbi:MAG TPA: lytic transglycosylase domain-containing protein [Thermodesulfobacteriota bacterium]|nr:lytic transglycosylase domain-containing protein [Thermodesulfobacteriota bacterium]
MFKRDHSILVFSVIGLFKFSCVFYLLYLSGFLFFKLDGIYYLKITKPLKVKRRAMPLGSLADPVAGVGPHTGTETLAVDIEEAIISRFITKFSDEISHSDANKLAKLIRQECEKYALDPLLVLAVIQIESEFSPMAVSQKGAVGLMQVMPRTAEFVAAKLGIPLNGSKSLHDPFLNVKLGIYYLSLLTKQFGNVERALVAYNVGPNKSFSSGTKLGKSTSAFVRKVLNFRSLLESTGVIVTEES